MMKYIALTMGDPSGIGPEIILKLYSRHNLYQKACPVVIGDAGILEFYKNLYLFKEIVIQSFSSWEEIVRFPLQENMDGRILLWDRKHVDIRKFAPSEVSASSGKAAFRYIDDAINLALAGEVSANVTAPVCKESLHLAGYNYPGHTEIYADKTGTSHYMMALFTPTLKVAHLTCHIALKDIFPHITVSNIQWACKLLWDTMRQMGIKKPRIGVCGLNPHCSENGLFGNEEQEIIIPALKELRRKKIIVLGPVPADTIFARGQYGEYDIILALYHDQGHIAVKTLNYKKTEEYFAFSGVNITLGLPIIRTSVDHGTAFDIVGKNCASEQSLYEAFQLALSMIPDTRG